jgi:hypothetical protein
MMWNNGDEIIADMRMVSSTGAAEQGSHDQMHLFPLAHHAWGTGGMECVAVRSLRASTREPPAQVMMGRTMRGMKAM